VGQGLLHVWRHGQLVLTTAVRSQSGSVVVHPEQFDAVLPTAQARQGQVPLGHQVVAPLVAQRSLGEYDQLCGVEVAS
jgi:hypothetical protein